MVFIDESGDSLFSGVQPTAFGQNGFEATDSKLYVTAGVFADFDSINSVRSQIAETVGEVTAGTTFGIHMFENAGFNDQFTIDYNAGFFRVEVGTSTSDLKADSDFSVVPLAELYNVDTSIWGNPFTSVGAIGLNSASTKLL